MKYLSRAGHEIHVITPRKPVKNVLDYSLCDDIPEDVKIHYTANWGAKGNGVQKIAKTKEVVSSNKSILKISIWKIIKGLNDLLLPYDKQIGWVPFAYLKALKVIRKEKIKIVYITSYPFSAQIVGIW
ncbi:MAG: hypothetical protein P9L91_05085, partial [Candidatus Zophobacter franzmannii]|nr:hypothetical protein [Candidatus Zophobacter franzmannii]